MQMKNNAEIMRGVVFDEKDMKFVMPSMKFMPAKVMISLGLVTKTIFVRKNGIIQLPENR